jgi:ribosomal protein L11 methylase PrmA
MEHKRSFIAEQLELVKPRQVWDFGANTGFFSRVASARGIQTVAFDVDLAAVDKSYRQVRQRNEDHILPLMMDLTNPSPGIGWNFEERMSLLHRGPVDLALALALVHHLAISNNVPLPLIAEFFRGICSSLIIEFVPKGDSQVERLLATREDVFPDYTQEGFEHAFARYFEMRARYPIRDSERLLYLFEQERE